MISVLAVDDHPLILNGLERLFESTSITIVAKANSLHDVEQLIAIHSPDVVLLDVRLNGRDGLKTLEEIKNKNPDQQVVVYSGYDNPTYVGRAVALGAHNYVLKGESAEGLIKAIHDARDKVEPHSNSLFQRIKTNLNRRKTLQDSEFALTRRELQVIKHLGLGLSNREIGKSLGISIETVKEHVQNVLRKINANDRTQAAVWAVKRGLAD